MSVVDRAEGYEPGFDLCLEAGHQAEEYVRHLLRHLLLGNERIEVKRDDVALSTGNIYIEYAHKPRGSTEYVPSGIANEPGADYWAIVIGDVIVITRTEALKYVARRGIKAEHTTGNNPTKGMKVPLKGLIKALAEAPF